MRRLNTQTHKELTNMTFAARPVTYTAHAKGRASEKNIILPRSVYINAGDVVELELTNNRLSKLVVRQPLDKKRDRVMVLVPNGECWTCITVWTNNKTDKHSTLNKARLTA
jgi:hypothetical protein